jgi:hypothetical protein
VLVRALAFIVASFARFAVLVSLSALHATGFCLSVAHPLVAVVTNAAFVTQSAQAECADISERNNEDPSIPAFILAVLVPSHVVLFVLVADERKVIYRFTCQRG